MKAILNYFGFTKEIKIESPISRVYISIVKRGGVKRSDCERNTAILAFKYVRMEKDVVYYDFDEARLPWHETIDFLEFERKGGEVDECGRKRKTDRRIKRNA